MLDAKPFTPPTLPFSACRTLLHENPSRWRKAAKRAFWIPRRRTALLPAGRTASRNCPRSIGTPSSLGNTSPGCHASGFIALAAPLVAAGLIPADTLLSCFSLTGYSGGGKKMIAQYEADTRTPDLDAPRPYGLTQSHKHLPEMQQISCLTHAPIFAPIVADYYAGMQVTIPLFRQQLNCAHPVEELTACLKAHYASSPIVSVLDAQDVAAFGGFIPANALAGKDSMKLMVLGNDDRIELVSLFDNLGKGSSGAAIECLNLMTGAPETTGLNL